MHLDQDVLNDLLANPDSDLELFKFYRKQVLGSGQFEMPIGLHSCEQGRKQLLNKSYFGYATTECIITGQSKLHESVHLSKMQITAIDDLYLDVDIDLSKFQNFIHRYGNTWWLQFAHPSSPAKSTPVFTQNQYSQFERALEGLSPSLFMSGLKLASSPLFKDVETKHYLPLTQRQIEQIINERLFSRFVWEHFKCNHMNDSKTCEICRKKFSIKNSMPLFLGIPALICFGCCATSPPSEVGKNNTEEYQSVVRARLVFAAMRFVEHYKLVPASNYVCTSAAISSANESLTSKEVILNWTIAANMPDLHTVNELFGSWAKYLAFAGVLEKSRSGQSGYRSFATDGHLCLSVGERQICEFLYQNGIQHEREPIFPQDDEFNKNGLKRADFVIGETFVELAGRMSQETYAAGIKEKISLAQKLGFQLLVVTPKELPDLEKVFRDWLF